MGRTLGMFSGIFIAIFILSAVFAGSAYAGGKLPLGCVIFIEKEAGDTDTLFTFLVEPLGGANFEIDLFSGEGDDFGLNIGETVVVTEIVPDGWSLIDIDCGSENGFNFFVDEASNSFLVTCQSPGVAGCRFTNRNTDAIPTLSEWGMISVVVGLGLVGAWFAIRKRRAVRA